MQLNPLETFTVVRQIEDHTDASTYYVRAVIRNAKTDALITTLDLTNQGSQRFSKNWQVSPDVSGQVFYISILTSVYTDSGYTTKSQNYGDKMETYLVQQRMNNNLGGMGGGGGADVDYKKIRKILDEVVKTRLGLGKDEESIEIPNIPEVITVTKEVPVVIDNRQDQKVNLDPVMKVCKKIMGVIDIIKAKELDIKPVISKLDDLAVSISNKIDSRTDEVAGKIDELGDSLEQEDSETTETPEEPKEVEEQPKKDKRVDRMLGVKSPIQDVRIKKILTKI